MSLPVQSRRVLIDLEVRTVTDLTDFGGGVLPEKKDDTIAHDTRTERAKHRLRSFLQFCNEHDMGVPAVAGKRGVKHPLSISQDCPLWDC